MDWLDSNTPNNFRESENYKKEKKKVLTCHSSQTSNKIKVEEAWRHLWLLYCSYALHFNHHCNCCYLVGRITNKACCLLLFVSCCVCSITLLNCLHSSLPSSPLHHPKLVTFSFFLLLRNVFHLSIHMHALHSRFFSFIKQYKYNFLAYL